MKFITLFASLALFGMNHLKAQTFDGNDVSPMDSAYFPDNFAHDREAGEEAVMKVYYSRPAKNSRELFGNLVPYNEVWRTGANEATQITLYKDVTFAGKKLAAGTYSLFTVPGKSEWTIIFNAALDYWGAYSYEEGDDVLRVMAKATDLDQKVESFSIGFTGASNSAGTMMLAWGDVLVNVPFTY